MGIKYLTTFLDENPTLCHEICLKWNSNNDPNEATTRVPERNLIIWDCLGWIKRLYGWRSRNTKLLFDFKQLNRECRQLIDTFKRFGFELIAFVDGYHQNDKTSEKRRRKLQQLRNIRKNIKILKQIHETDPKQRKSLINKFEFVPSSGYSHYLEQALTHNGCKVYRGSAHHDIDKDIAQFVVNHKDKIYGIISVDTDYFGFFNLPEDCRLIKQFHIRSKHEKSSKSNDEINGKRRHKSARNTLSEQSLHLLYYYASEVWNKLGLQTNDERLQLISLCGNDFIRKRPPRTVLKRCGIDIDALNINKQWTPAMNEEKETTDDTNDDVLEQDMNSDAVNTENVSENKQDIEATNSANKTEETKQGYEICATVANAIKTNTVSPPIKIATEVRAFYFLEKDINKDTTSYFDNINVSYHGLKQCKLFHGGFFFHDVDRVGFTIHEKLSNIRNALIHKHIGLDVMDELVPHLSNPNVYEIHEIDLKSIPYAATDWNLKLLTKHKNFPTANLYFVCKDTLNILSSRRYIDHIQHRALLLQFEVRFSLKKVYRNNKWPFSKEYTAFRRNGIPRVEDLTAQCLYWECARLICLGPINILPNICQLFDGPLFHFFCFEQVNGDKHGIIEQLLQTLQKHKASRPGPKKRAKHNQYRYNNHHSQYRTYGNNRRNVEYQQTIQTSQNYQHINSNQYYSNNNNNYSNNNSYPTNRHFQP